MDAQTLTEFLNELCPRLRPLITRVMDCPCGCETLDLLRLRARTWLTASDIAYHVNASIEHVQVALELFVSAEIVERHDVMQWTFYALARDEGIQTALEQYWLQRDDWRDRVTRMQETLHLHPAA
jgi:hypothetical protein